jgi:hypothetical protein
MQATLDRAQQPGVAVEDITGVRSRISWAAILGGSVITLATYLVLTFLSAALGLSFTDVNTRGDALAIGAVVVAVIVMAGSLFLGGWVTTQLTVGENSREAVIYGVLTWAVVTAMSLFLLGTGVRAGYMALMGTTLVGQQQANAEGKTWEQMARENGVSQEQINEWRSKTDPERVKAELNDPANRERARQNGATAAWALVGGTLLSIGAAAGGALVGRGSTFRLFPMAVATHTERTIIRP